MIEQIKQCYFDEANCYPSLINGYAKGGDEGMVCLGAVTPRIAVYIGEPISVTRRKLHKLFQEGKLLKRQSRSGGSIRWWLVGYTEEFLNRVAAEANTCRE